MNNLIELLRADGLHLKKVTMREYHSPCPICGGKDRFVIWPEHKETGRGWCRKCGLNIDGVGYLMRVHGMDYRDAAQRIAEPLNSISESSSVERTAMNQEIILEPDNHCETPGKWTDTAARFVEWAAENLRRNSEQIDWLHRERGISPSTAEAWRLGWNPESLKRSGKPWGLEGELFLPEGLVIPNNRNRKPVSVKIRKQAGEPKYHLVRGSKVFPYMLPGEVRGTIAIVEGEFDALLLWETARDVLTPIALGGCSNHPDPDTFELMAGAAIILNCLDNDEPGERASTWWSHWFPQCARWRPTAKDPGEMFLSGQDVRRWVFQGIREVLTDRGIWPGKLDFYEAVDELAAPLPPEMLQNLTEEQIERLAIQMQNIPP